MIMDNSEEFVECLLEIWNKGMCAVLLDKKVPVESLIELLELCNVSKCYVDSKKLYDQIKQYFDVVLIDVSRDNFVNVSTRVFDKFIEKYDNSEAIILFSSGTTGKRKGIILSHYAIQNNADSIIEYMNIKKTDRLLILKSLVHSSTLVGELLVGLKCRCQLFIVKKIWNFSHILSKMHKEMVNFVCINPSILLLMNKQEYVDNNFFENLEKIYISGSVLNKEIIRSFKQKVLNVKVFNVYGLTEMGPRVTAQRDENPITSVGHPIKGVSVKIVNSKGEETREFEKGIIQVKSNSSYLGYVNGEERKRYYKDYFNTGDIGWKDDNDNYFIVGRSDDMIITASYNVYPDEVEEIIMSIEGIIDCLVFGVPNDIYGELIICYYKASLDCNEMLISCCKNKLPLYEIPKEFIKVSEIPVNANGKKDRKLAREYYYKYYYN